jgi:hypothetical protein
MSLEAKTTAEIIKESKALWTLYFNSRRDDRKAAAEKFELEKQWVPREVAQKEIADAYQKGVKDTEQNLMQVDLNGYSRGRADAEEEIADLQKRNAELSLQTKLVKCEGCFSSPTLAKLQLRELEAKIEAAKQYAERTLVEHNVSYKFVEMYKTKLDPDQKEEWVSTVYLKELAAMLETPRKESNSEASR